MLFIMQFAVIVTGIIACLLGIRRAIKLRNQGRDNDTKFVMNCMGIGMAAFILGAVLYLYELIINI